MFLLTILVYQISKHSYNIDLKLEKINLLDKLNHFYLFWLRQFLFQANKNIFITCKENEEVILILKRIKMIQKSLLLHPQNRILEKVFNNGLGTKTTTGVTQSQQRVRSKAKYVFSSNPLFFFKVVWVLLWQQTQEQK